MANSEIAFSADLHLSESHPERLEILEYILSDLEKKDIDILIIAGDLLDKQTDVYPEIDSLFSKFSSIQIHAIPGNHDIFLIQEMFTSSNLKVHSRPEIASIKNRKFLFLPFKQEGSMGGDIEDFKEELDKQKWILISHGDYGGIASGYTPEKGGYYPLTRADLNKYRPARAILGHIHSNVPEKGKIMYPGSPYPMDKNETGIRKYILFDTKKMEIQWIVIEQGPVYLQESITVIPLKEEDKYIKKQVRDLKRNIKKKIGESIKRTQLHLSVKGYTGWGKNNINDFLNENLGIGFKNIKIDTQNLKFTKGEELSDISTKVKKIIEKKKLPESRFISSKQDIITKAMEFIYG